jgi:hypothetical protein
MMSARAPGSDHGWHVEHTKTSSQFLKFVYVHMLYFLNFLCALLHAPLVPTLIAYAFRVGVCGWARWAGPCMSDVSVMRH